MAEPPRCRLRAARRSGLTSPDQVKHPQRPQQPPDPDPEPGNTDRPQKRSAAIKPRPENHRQHQIGSAALRDISRWIEAKADVRDYDALTAAVETGVEAFGGLDFVLANAGIFAAGRAWEIQLADWREMIDINLTGVWHTVRAAVPHLIDRGGGAIVITGSIDAVKATPNASSYAAAKHGTAGLMKSLANELGEYGIRVNSVNPTQVDTTMVQNEAVYRLFRPDLEAPTREDVVDAYAATNVLPIPWVEPRDISRAILWLLSDEARYVTGAALNVDAGYTIK